MDSILIDGSVCVCASVLLPGFDNSGAFSRAVWQGGLQPAGVIPPACPSWGITGELDDHTEHYWQPHMTLWKRVAFYHLCTVLHIWTRQRCKQIHYNATGS